MTHTLKHRNGPKTWLKTYFFGFFERGCICTSCTSLDPSLHKNLVWQILLLEIGTIKPRSSHINAVSCPLVLKCGEIVDEVLAYVYLYP